MGLLEQIWLFVCVAVTVVTALGLLIRTVASEEFLSQSSRNSSYGPVARSYSLLALAVMTSNVFFLFAYVLG